MPCFFFSFFHILIISIKFEDSSLHFICTALNAAVCVEFTVYLLTGFFQFQVSRNILPLTGFLSLTGDKKRSFAKRFTFASSNTE